MATMNGSARPATDVTGEVDSVLRDVEGRREAPRPNPEVVARAKRRRYTGEYKQKILTQTDMAKGSGEVGAVLRREGLYSSHLTKWRRERADGILDGLAPQSAGRSQNQVRWPLRIRNCAVITKGLPIACAKPRS